MPKRIAVFASVVLALTGANIMQIWSLLVAFLFTDQLPTSLFFTIVFWLWVGTAAIAVWCGLQGGYSLILNGQITTSALTVFAVMSCIMLKVSGHELGYSSVRLGFNVGIADMQIGLNVLGVGLVWWLAMLRRNALGPVSAMHDVETTRGHGAV